MIITLNNYTISLLPKSVLDDLSLNSYVFNPSYLKCHGNFFLTVRVYCEKAKAIISKMYIWGKDGDFEIIDLTQYFFQKLNLVKVADPKLFIMNNQVWCTFNNGYLEKEENDVVLFEMEGNKIKTYFKCNYNQRSRIEKNWAFYFKDESIHCLYNLNNLTILRGCINKDENIIEFKFDSSLKNSKIRGYSIGTQLIERDKAFLLIAHKKIIFFGKRLYLGRPVKVKLHDSTEIKTYFPFLIHSIKSFFGSKFKFNKNLISCTYFSGIFQDGDSVVVSYGINDVSWSFSKIKHSKLWR